MRGSATTLDFQCTSLNTIGNVELTNRMKRELKTEHEWLGKVNSQALQSGLRNLDTATLKASSIS